MIEKLLCCIKCGKNVKWRFNGYCAECYDKLFGKITTKSNIINISAKELKEIVEK